MLVDAFYLVPGLVIRAGDPVLVQEILARDAETETVIARCYSLDHDGRQRGYIGCWDYGMSLTVISTCIEPNDHDTRQESLANEHPPR